MKVDIDHLLQHAKTCKAVYPGPTNHKILLNAGELYQQQKYVYGSLGRGYCRVFWNSSSVAIAFRGTRGKYDWVHTDFKALPESLANCADVQSVRVHRGFQRALLAIDRGTSLPGFDAIIRRMEENDLVGRPLTAIGHSLGGALAVLFSVMYRARFSKSPIREIVTFGSPAVGNSAFADFYGDLHSKTTRVVNGGDPVPFTPPIGYRHVGQEVWLSAGGIAPSRGWRSRLRVSAELIRSGDLGASHSMISYIASLKAVSANASDG